MGYTKWMNANLKKLSWTDIHLIKIAVAAFALMAAKLWQPLLSLNWYWYAVICIAAAAWPLYKMYLK